MSVQNSLELVQQAIQLDRMGQYEGAYDAYLSAIASLKQALIEEVNKSPQLFQVIQVKINEYQKRANVLQQYLNGIGSGVGTTTTTLSSQPSSSSSTTTIPVSPPKPAPRTPPASSPSPPTNSSSPSSAQTLASSAPAVPQGDSTLSQTHLRFDWLIDHNARAFVREWRFSWDSRRDTFNLADRSKHYIRSSFSLVASAEGSEKTKIELSNHKVQRYSEKTSQWEAPLRVGSELQVTFTVDKQGHFLVCSPDCQRKLGAEPAERQWQTWAGAWSGVDLTKETDLVDEEHAEIEVDKKRLSYTKHEVKLKKTVSLKGSVVVYEALVELATGRPHTAAFTACSLDSEQRATIEKQLFVFTWADAHPIDESNELTTEAQPWDVQFDKEVHKNLQELQDNMARMDIRPEPKASLPTRKDDEGKKEEEEELQENEHVSTAGEDISNALLLAEINLLKQEMAMLKDVYIKEMLNLKSMVRTLLTREQAQQTNSTGTTLQKHPGSNI